MTNTMSMSLLHLPPEMLTRVASYLDLSSYIALSKSCSLLLNTLAPHPEKWKVLLQNTKMGLGQVGSVRKAREAGRFLAFLENPDNKLILELFHKICAGNPAVSRTIPFVQDLSSLQEWLRFGAQVYQVRFRATRSSHAPSTTRCYSAICWSCCAHRDPL